jgi:hypothetical protein
MKLLQQILERTRDLGWFILATFLIYTFIYVPQARADDMSEFHKVLAAECVTVLNRDAEHLPLVERVTLKGYTLIEDLPKDLENRIIRLNIKIFTINKKKLTRGNKDFDNIYCGVNTGLGLVFTAPSITKVASFVRSGLPNGAVL